MGAVKESVQGSPKKGTTPGTEKQSLINRLTEIADEISNNIAIKEKDVDDEGSAERAANMYKVGVLRASFSLVRLAKQLLESYDTAK